VLTANDLLCLPYTRDLTEAGIQYACRSLPHTYDRMGGSQFDRLRRIVVGIAVELAFRRYLAQQNVPFGVEGATPFTDPDRYDVSLGGHRCDIKSFLISYREQIRALHADPALLLDAPGLVPLDQYAGDEHSANDLYVFAFLTGLVAAHSADVKKAVSAGEPVYPIHAMPPSWVRPPVWTPLGPLVLKSECDVPVMLELGGQDSSRDFCVQKVEVSPRTRVPVRDDFYSLACVHTDAMPEARIGIYSSRRQETYIIQPGDWGNIWVYGMRIYLTGWVTRDQFRQRASLLPAGSRVFQYDRTRTRNLALPISHLYPLGELLEQTRAWARVKSNGPGTSVV
jgi:hypothetical protein